MKRTFDFCCAILALLLLLPIMVLVSLLIRIKLGSPVFFVQERPGLNGKVFRMFKFRTMRNDKNSKNELLSDSERMTSLGTFIRSTSLDELPGLINIIKGDMSIVGPRPLLIEYMPLYSERQRRRHSVRPGLTGWAQVNGRNAISWKEKFD